MSRADWREKAGLDRLLEALDADAGTTRFVGGVVRDTLLGLPVKDVDLATRLLPDEIMARVRDAGLKPVPTGLAHGTITAVLPGGPVEVTTLRRDVETDGRHAVVAFTDDWRADAARRDFTFNALSAGAGFGRGGAEVHDYFGGRDDLAAGRTRFIGDALTRIAEDHLRILRFFRFHARFGGREPDAEGLAACATRANDLMALSRERIADEMVKLLAVADPAPTLRLMVEHGILRPVLPEIGVEGVARLERLVAREAAFGVAGDSLRRLAALLPPDAALAGEVAARLRLSKVARGRLEEAATARPKAEPASLAYLFGRDAAIDRLLIGDGSEAEIRSLDLWSRPRLPIGGGDLIALGLRAGPLVARTLQAVERRWIEEGFPAEARVRLLAEQEVATALGTQDLTG